VHANDLRWDLARLPTRPGDDPLVEALVEALAYRDLAQQALHSAHALLRQLEQLQARYLRLLEAHRPSKVRT